MERARKIRGSPLWTVDLIFITLVYVLISGMNKAKQTPFAKMNMQMNDKIMEKLHIIKKGSGDDSNILHDLSGQYTEWNLDRNLQVAGI